MSFLASVEAGTFFTWLRESDSIWAFPTVLMLHALGMMLLSGAAAVLDLRLLGMARGIPIASLRPLFPVMWGGFSLNAVSGALLFGAYATSKGAMPLFFIKLGFVCAGVVTIVLIRREVYPTTLAAEPVSSRGRVLAVASLMLWVAAITAGRLLAYVE